MVGLEVPLLPLAHQYVITTPLPELEGVNELPKGASKPILRYQDKDLYYREWGDRIGIGSYAHRPCRWTCPRCRGWPRTRCPTTACRPGSTSRWRTSLPAWEDSQDLLPALRSAADRGRLQRHLLLHPGRRPAHGRGTRTCPASSWPRPSGSRTPPAWPRPWPNCWSKAGSRTDLHGCELTRFEKVQTSDSYVSETSQQNFVEIYDVLHPLQPRESPRDLRVSPFNVRQKELGAFFLESAGWERPHWFEANRGLLAELPEEWRAPERDEWAAMFSLPHLRRRSVEDAHRRRTLRHDAAEAALRDRPRARRRCCTGSARATSPRSPAP